ncbi:MAG: hypothetical protein QOD31_2600, partial [Pseudonocardiales bacterium]|nr:hypothetical protein [Pseudonocardiales bacterium]
YAAIGGITASASLADGDLATASTLVDRFQKLAAEAPAAAKADMALLANDLTSLMSTGTPTLSDQDAQAAADRVDAVAEVRCNG